MESKEQYSLASCTGMVRTSPRSPCSRSVSAGFAIDRVLMRADYDRLRALPGYGSYD